MSYSLFPLSCFRLLSFPTKSFFFLIFNKPTLYHPFSSRILFFPDWVQPFPFNHMKGAHRVFRTFSPSRTLLPVFCIWFAGRPIPTPPVSRYQPGQPRKSPHVALSRLTRLSRTDLKRSNNAWYGINANRSRRKRKNRSASNKFEPITQPQISITPKLESSEQLS